MTDRELRGLINTGWALSATRLSVLQMILRGAKRGIPPTVRDIADELRCNVNAARLHLDRCRKLGLISIPKEKGVFRRGARAITPLFRFIPAADL